jgi:uncharacterized membrane protein
MTIDGADAERRTAEWRAVGLVILALIGLGVSLALAAFQLGIVNEVWDPIFGNGAQRVLTSPISRALPVPDAVIGAAAYAVEAVLGTALVFGVRRAAIVAATLAVASVMAAVVGIALAVAQPVVAHAGCTLCLISTAVSVVLAAGASAEARDRWPGWSGHDERRPPAVSPLKEDHR